MNMLNVAHAGTPIHALVIGHGDVSSNIVSQLSKNPRFHTTWVGLDLMDDDYKIMEHKSVIRVIKLTKAVTPMSLNELAAGHNPDIIFFCQRGKDSGSGSSIASSNLESELLAENALICEAPIINVSVDQ